MKTYRPHIFFAAACSLFVAGCSVTREPLRYRDNFFQPVSVMPPRTNTAISSAELNQVHAKLEAATSAVKTLRDSLASLQHFAGELLASTRALIDKVSQLETREYLTSTKQSSLEQSLALLQSENKQLSQQIVGLRSHLLASSPVPEPQVFAPARSVTSLRNEYAEGVTLVQHRKYNEAVGTFESLLEKGIDEDLSDNCEYWIGECKFALREYQDAVTAFQKVLAIQSSNKKIDAYFMLGKSYEQLGDLVKARWAYSELNTQYPRNAHSGLANTRLEALKRSLPSPRESRQKKPAA